MTQPVQEPSQGRVNQGLEFRTRQLFRRPASTGTGFVSVTLQIKVYADDVVLVTGDGQFSFMVSADFGGTNLVGVASYVTVPSSSGKPTVQFRNFTAGNNDMLSTKLSIDAGEYTSYSASVPAVIDPAFQLVNTGDIISIDVDVSGTGATGLGVVLDFETPPA